MPLYEEYIDPAVYRDGWQKPLPLSDYLEFEKNQPMSTLVQSLQNESKLSWDSLEPVLHADELTLELFVRALTIPSVNLQVVMVRPSSNTIALLRKSRVDWGEVIYVVARNPAALLPSNKDRAFSDAFVNTMKTARFILGNEYIFGNDHSTLAWVLMFTEDAGLNYYEAIKSIQHAVDRGYTFDEVAPFVSAGLTSIEAIGAAIDNDVDITLAGSL